MATSLPAITKHGGRGPAAPALARRRNISRSTQRRDREIIMTQETRLDRYRAAIGRARHDLITPALLLDLDIARNNINTMAAYMRTVPARLRPHIKVHKSPELARMQMQAGECIGMTTATVWEAQVMVHGGIAD